MNLRASGFLALPPTYITFLIVTSYMDVLASCHKGSVFSYPDLPAHHVSKVSLEHQQLYPLKIGPSFRSVPQNKAIHFTTTAGTHISLLFFQMTAAAVKQRTDCDKSFRLSSCVDCLGSLIATAPAACVGPAVASALSALVSQGLASAGTPPRETAS